MRRLFYALDGGILSSLELMVKDIVAPSWNVVQWRQSCASLQRWIDPLLLGSTGTFNIQAYSTMAYHLTEGDNFQVGIRFTGAGHRVRSKVVDHDDGTYTVTYKPTSSGKF